MKAGARPGPGVLLVPPLTQSPLEPQPANHPLAQIPAWLPACTCPPSSLIYSNLQVPQSQSRGCCLTPTLQGIPRPQGAFPNTSGGVFPSRSCPSGFPPDSPGLHSIFFRCFASRARAASPVILPVPSRIPQGNTSLGTLTHPSLEVFEAHCNGGWGSCMKNL